MGAALMNWLLRPRHLAIMAAAVLLILAVVWHQRHAAAVVESAVQAERDRISAFALERAAAHERRVVELETRHTIAALENEIEIARLQAMVAAAADRARAADERLRDAVSDLRRRAQAATQAGQPAGFAHEAAAAATALGECSGRYRAVAETADQLSIQVTGLQRFVADTLAVCTAGE